VTASTIVNTGLPPRLHMSRTKGSRYKTGHPDAICVKRPTHPNAHPRYGNPWHVEHIQAEHGISKDEARRIAADLYARWLDGDPDLAHVEPERRQWILDNLHQLAGHPLGCSCDLPAPGQVDHCHAAVLIALANKPTR